MQNPRDVLKPGTHADLDADQYHRDPAIGSSDLKKLLADTPEHLYDAWRERQERDDAGQDESSTPTLDFGKAYHCAVLEPDRFLAEYAVALSPEDLADTLDTVDDLKAACRERDLKVTGTKDALIERLLAFDPALQVKAELTRLHTEKHDGKTLLSWEDGQHIEKMGARLLQHREIAATLSDGIAEVSMVWDDAETGVRCKIRPDWIRTLSLGQVFLMDLKTTKSARPDAWNKDVTNYGYHISAAFYLEGYRAVTGNEIVDDAFAYALQEKTRPYAPAYRLLNKPSLAVGHREVRRALRTIAECMNKGVWHGYEGIEECGLAPWGFTSEQEDVPIARLAA